MKFKIFVKTIEKSGKVQRIFFVEEKTKIKAYSKLINEKKLKEIIEIKSKIIE